MCGSSGTSWPPCPGLNKEYAQSLLDANRLRELAGEEFEAYKQQLAVTVHQKTLARFKELAQAKAKELGAERGGPGRAGQGTAPARDRLQQPGRQRDLRDRAVAGKRQGGAEAPPAGGGGGPQGPVRRRPAA